MSKTPIITFFFIAIAILLGADFVYAVTVEIAGQNEAVQQQLAAATASDYLSNLYVWMLGIVGLASLFALIYGGVLYIFSGAIESTSEAKRWMTNALWGLLLAATSWLILNTINPELVKKFGIGEIIYKYCMKAAKTAEDRAVCEKTREQ